MIAFLLLCLQLAPPFASDLRPALSERVTDLSVYELCVIEGVRTYVTGHGAALLFPDEPRIVRKDFPFELLGHEYFSLWYVQQRNMLPCGTGVIACMHSYSIFNLRLFLSILCL